MKLENLKLDMCRERAEVYGLEEGETAQQPNGSVSIGSSLTATPDANPWLSSSGEFAFGFQQVQGKDNFLLSIWYEKIPNKTIIWYPQGGPTVSPGSKVDLVDRRGLVLSDPQGKEVWSSNSISDLAYGYMNDTGNFVIMGSNSLSVWDSFDHPTDTMLPTQVMLRGGVINSKMSQMNFTRGRFQLRMLQDGNLVLNTRDMITGSPDNAYYISDTFDASNSTNSGDQLIFDATGYMYILRRNGVRSNLTQDSIPSGDYYHRATLDSDVAIYRDNQCWKKQLPLKNGYKDPAFNVKALLKFRKIDGPPETGENRSGTKDKSRRSLIFIGSALLGMSMLVIVVLIVVIYVCFVPIQKKKAVNLPSNSTVETNLHRFTYQELVKATNGFKDELGKGAFGIVYKGVIGTKIVAVKRLEGVLQDGQKEFKNEVNTIARTHHKNLVQLLGYCDDSEQQLLIYEYMSKGTLALFLFGETRPSWKQRSYIALGVAKGLAYLHEDCSNQIIHCDIKPQNILLDDYYNAKIADFGLAKLLMINQSRTNTGIRGTKGYVAPEWFRNTPVKFKVDVYSFGVLLLEIISCRKSVVFEDDTEDVAVLTDLAWDCYQEGRLDMFVNNDLEALNDFEKLTAYIMIGLWCVHENPSMRPTMKKVIQMLEGGIQVTEPPCPCPVSVTS
ncbi:hypothetical protein E3N88_14864 [Mikania micrantha]|uniref:non-specific serine/threonine protein kinase n=1 Tax=Mikania micrantha TaxID=192012 RepID=A0A5N6P2N2_9ASTR|nr:hypothetical protein E3N88_14864 [Mikania micrantha]